jgi:hypothetical protein
MSTRSRLGLELADGSILSVYHHWDGYPEWLGRILKTHYNTKEKVEELIDGGDMSSCWTNMRWTKEGAEEVEEYGAEYYSGRGEDCPPRLDASLQEYLCDGEEYAYIFNRMNEWICYSISLSSKTAKLVEIPSGALHV